MWFLFCWSVSKSRLIQTGCLDNGCEVGRVLSSGSNPEDIEIVENAAGTLWDQVCPVAFD